MSIYEGDGGHGMSEIPDDLSTGAKFGSKDLSDEGFIKTPERHPEAAMVAEFFNGGIKKDSKINSWMINLNIPSLLVQIKKLIDLREANGNTSEQEKLVRQLIELFVYKYENNMSVKEKMKLSLPTKIPPGVIKQLNIISVDLELARNVIKLTMPGLLTDTI